MGVAVVFFLVGFGLLATGVLIGRYYVPDDRDLKRTARHSRGYMRAINHLLARDKDAAIDELRKIVQEDVSDVEPYFALGALFRSRGEWERAVRVHQSIELRPDVNKRMKLRAVYELGLDFRAAGMPRRATKAMEQCLADDNKHEGALRALCGLYEEQRYYADAADAWGRLERLRDDGETGREVHLWAAAARQAIDGGDLDAAKRHLKRAERRDADEPHVIATAAELAAAKGNPRGASKQLQRALVQRPALAAYFVPALEQAERQQLLLDQGVTGDSELDDERREELSRLAGDRTGRILDEVIEQTGNAPALLLTRAQIRARSDMQGALEDLRLVLERDSRLLPARVAAARLVLATGDEAACRAELAALMAPDGALARLTEGVWQCGHCQRFETEFFWRCDGCRSWGTARFDTDRTRTGDRRRPRERRTLPRAMDRGSTGLPGPVDAGDASSPRRPGIIGRAGSWIAGALSGRRDKTLPPDDDNRLSE